jgi:flagellar P-ring protein precursor FlgI
MPAMLHSTFRLIFMLLSLTALPAAAHAERIKDIGQFQGLRTNQLTGYGVVVGLSGTGDDSLDYATLGVKGAVSRFGLNLPAGINPALKNAAAVMITAELPPFAKPGQKIDITVSAIGKAKSLRGGTLVLAPLIGADGQIYAMAQGNLVIGGLGIAAADGSKTIVNDPAAGRIEGGATVERSVQTGFASTPDLTFNLTDSDLTNAKRVADAINRNAAADIARAVDGTSIHIAAPVGAETRVAMMSRIENLEITPAEAPARVVVNARTGTVVINGAVRVGPAAVSHGKLTVRIDEEPQVSQPAPFSQGQTVVTPSSNIDIEEHGSPMFLMPRGANLSDIVDSINRLGASPGDLVAILGALKQAGALTAELVIQ